MDSMQPLSERELVCLFVKRKRGRGIIFVEEAALFTSQCDLLAYSRKTKAVTAYEFKLNDWRRAIAQAVRLGVAADFVYLCLARPRTREKESQIREEVRKLGIGLYVFDDGSKRFIELEKPRQSCEMIRGLKDQVVSVHFINGKARRYVR